MAVLRKVDEEIPQNAVFLDSTEAVEYQWKHVLNHQPQYEMWSFRYGLPLLSIGVGASCIFVNGYIRRGLHLRQYGRILSYVPLTVTPAILALMLQKILVSDAILLQSVPCSLCLDSRTVGIQIGLGILYPIVVSPVVNSLIAYQLATIRLPEISNLKGNMDLFKKITKPLVRRLPYLFCAHIITAVFMTNAEMKAYNRMYDKLLREEETSVEEVKS